MACHTRPVATFRYAPEIVERYPAVRGGVLHAANVRNGPSSEDLSGTYRAAQEAALEEIGTTPLSELAGIAAWRRVFTSFGVKPTQYRNAAEALLRRLTKQGSIPTINTLVDLGNLVAVRHRLPVAIFDQKAVSGATTVRFAAGDEWFTDLGSGQAGHPEVGEVVFVDEMQLVSARRWCWRQSAQSAAGPDTTEVLITVEGHHEEAARDVADAVADLESLLAAHQPMALVRSTVLSPARLDTPW